MILEKSNIINNIYFNIIIYKISTIIKIIPMINPDGVIFGNYRTGVAGRDLNREFKEPDKLLFPEVVAIK